MRPTPVMTTNQRPRSTQRSAARYTTPVAAVTPARIPPETDVMPARYTVVSRASPPRAVNELKVMVPWR